jgi:hypothetical protein
MMLDCPAQPASDDELLSRELDGQLLQLRGLILVRRLLAERGATQPEVDSHTTQIHRLRNELSNTFRDSAADTGSPGF